MAEIYPFTGFRFAQTSILSEEKQVINFFSKNTNAYPFDLLIKEKILIEDRLPSIYVYFQYYKYLVNSEKVTKGFICNLKLSDWADGIVLRHEHVNPKSVQFQKFVLKKGSVFTNPIHGMYCDSNSELDIYMNESILNPLLDYVDRDATRHVLSVIHDKKVILKFLEVVKDKKITIADGHHRYTAGLEKSKIEDTESFIPAFLTNTSNNCISVAAYHRLLKYNKSNDEQILLKLRNNFIISETDFKTIENKHFNNNSFAFIISGKPYSGIPLQSNYNSLLAINKLIEEFSDNTKTTPVDITYENNINGVLQSCKEGKFDLGILLTPFTAEEIMELSMKGEILPEKSTCFFPKVLNGIIIKPVLRKDNIKKLPCFDE